MSLLLIFCLSIQFAYLLRWLLNDFEICTVSARCSSYTVCVLLFLLLSRFCWHICVYSCVMMMEGSVQFVYRGFSVSVCSWWELVSRFADR